MAVVGSKPRRPIVLLDVVGSRPAWPTMLLAVVGSGPGWPTVVGLAVVGALTVLNSALMWSCVAPLLEPYLGVWPAILGKSYKLLSPVRCN